MKFLRGTRGGRVRVLAIPLVAIVAALALAACGGSSSGSSATGKSASAGTTSTSTSTSSGSTSSTSGSTTTSGSGPGSSKFAAQRAKLAKCLKQHGVTLPKAPAGGYRGHYGGGAQGPRTGPNGAPPTGSGTTPHTFTRPPGGFRGGGGGGGGFFRKGAGSNSKFAKAIEACGGFGGGAFGGGRFGGGRARGGAGGAGGSGQAPHLSATLLKKFVACVRTHGYPQMPEASTSGNTDGGLFPKSIEGNKEFQKAAGNCENVLRSAYRQAPGTTSTS